MKSDVDVVDVISDVLFGLIGKLFLYREDLIMDFFTLPVKAVTGVALVHRKRESDAIVSFMVLTLL